MILYGFLLLAGVIAAFLVFKSRRSKAGPATVQGQGDQHQIYVGNLHYRVQEGELKQHFSQYGKVSDVRIVKNRKTGRSKTFAFISYRSANEAQKALRSHGEVMNTRSMVVRIARQKEQ